MNNKAIKTYDDLLLEEQQLTAKLVLLKTTIQEDITGVKQGVKDKINPIKKAKEKIKTLFVAEGKNTPAFNFVFNFVLDFIIRLFIPNRTSVWTKTVIPFMTKNYLSNLITDEHRKTFSRIMDNSVGKLDELIRTAVLKTQESSMGSHEETIERTAAADPPVPPNHTVETNPMGL